MSDDTAVGAQLTRVAQAPPARTLIDILIATVQSHADAPALDDGETRLTYAELMAAVESRQDGWPEPASGPGTGLVSGCRPEAISSTSQFWGCWRRARPTFRWMPTTRTSGRRWCSAKQA
jgi:hypothetical protein